MHGRLSDWLVLFALVAIWGSTFMFVKLALNSFPPPTLVAIRLTLGAVLLIMVLFTSKKAFSDLTPKLFFYLVIMAVIGNILPFSSISWGQQFVSSGLAGILMATMPLMTLLLSHFFIPEDRLTAKRIAGFLLGFIGVIILIGPSLLHQLSGDTVPAQLAILFGALCYAVNTIIAKKRPAGNDLLIAASVLSIAALIMLPVSSATEGNWLTEPVSLTSILAMAFIGIISTAVATVLYFRLVRTAGPAFLSQINYLIPVWALAVGAVFLGEDIQPSDIIALILLLAGLALANSKPRPSLSL